MEGFLEEVVEIYCNLAYRIQVFPCFSLARSLIFSSCQKLQNTVETSLSYSQICIFQINMCIKKISIGTFLIQWLRFQVSNFRGAGSILLAQELRSHVPPGRAQKKLILKAYIRKQSPGYSSSFHSSVRPDVTCKLEVNNLIR